MIWFKDVGTNVHSRGVGFEVRNNRLSHSQKFDEVSRIEIDWNKFHNRIEFRAYIKSLSNMENQ